MSFIPSPHSLQLILHSAICILSQGHSPFYLSAFPVASCLSSSFPCFYVLLLFLFQLTDWFPIAGTTQTPCVRRPFSW
jgi:hypothetical protein